MKKKHTNILGTSLPYIFILIFISGIVAGSVYARFFAGDFSFKVLDAPKKAVFLTSFESFLKPCVIVWIFGFSALSIYVSSVTLIYRGTLLGFVMGCFFKEYGATEGIKILLPLTLPQNIVYFPFLLFLCLAASGYKKEIGLFNYILLLALTLFVCAFSSATDTFITSFFIKI